jgi:uncharacterized integral membrane protein
MAEKENKPGFKILRTASIFTLILAVLMFILSIFNQQEVLFSSFGYRHKEVPMYYIVLWSFFAGGVYVAVLWILYAVKSIMEIQSLKKTIQELTEKLSRTGK